MSRRFPGKNRIFRSADFYIHPFHRPCGRGFVFTFIKKCVLVGGYSGMMELVETGGLRHFVLCSAHIAVIITFEYWAPDLMSNQIVCYRVW